MEETARTAGWKRLNALAERIHIPFCRQRGIDPNSRLGQACYEAARRKADDLAKLRNNGDLDHVKSLPAYARTAMKRAMIDVLRSGEPMHSDLSDSAMKNAGVRQWRDRRRIERATDYLYERVREVHAACRDPTDRLVCAAIAAGWKPSAIASVMGADPATVTRRIARIRERHDLTPIHGLTNDHAHTVSPAPRGDWRPSRCGPTHGRRCKAETRLDPGTRS